MKHVMIDIETLSLQPNAQVLSIGACVFDSAGNILDELELFPRFVEGRHISTDTVLWWLQQNDAARMSIVSPERMPRKDVHHQLEQFLLSAGNEQLEPQDDGTPVARFTPPPIWAIGPQFDMVVLQSYFTDLPSLWGYRQINDARTLRQFYKGEWHRPRVEHSALADAVAQATWTAEAMAYIGKALK